ncbi:hypothetical protein BGP77_03305 [Saccharospirillum sp. MSK14-1]|uniref:hypothetical protein n=1 Tax=Saccharospirillum sp. MSK14-1 TaxID=1897632 RepID=UPI000D38D877|nr:hypothetical protein [Saccharospirillum sp. MSK14-1]PTY36346.1 hypothetical protein BGP77_03305 [Saccharospirillum sp. MSK14-1]
MTDASLFQSLLLHAQWFAALLFVPLVCFLEAARSSVICRWSVLLSGYLVQYGLIACLIGSGFSQQAIILIGSVAAYAWIRLFAGWLKRYSVAARQSDPTQ